MGSNRGATLKRVFLLLSLMVVALGLSLSLMVVPYQVDDAFITYRYAANALAGHGFVYNAGDQATEGFSSPLWLAILVTGGALFGVTHLPLVSMGVGLLSYLAAIYFVGFAGAGKNEESAVPAGLLCICAFALLPTSTSYAVTGLETVAFAAIVGAFSASIAGYLGARTGVVAGAVALWARPEGAWLLFAGVLQLAGMRKLAWLRQRRVVLPLVSLLAGGALLVLLRLVIFGEIVPNTYHAKDPSLLEGWNYVRTTLMTPPFLALLACAVLGATMGSAKHRGYFLAGLSWLAAAILEGGDWMPGGRMLLPAFTMFALSTGGIARAAAPRWSRNLGWVLVLVAMSTQGAYSWRFARSGTRAFETYRHEARLVMDWVVQSGARSVALIDIGEIGFRTDLGIVDLAGLTDRVIGRSPGGHLRKEFDLGYLFEERQPDVILIRLADISVPERDLGPQVRPKDAMSGIEHRVLRDPRLAQNYELVVLQTPRETRRPLNARAIFVNRNIVLQRENLPTGWVVIE